MGIGVLFGIVAAVYHGAVRAGQRMPCHAVRAISDRDKLRTQATATVTATFAQVLSANLALVSAVANTIPNGISIFVNMGKGDNQPSTETLAGNVFDTWGDNGAILGAHQKLSFLVSSPGVLVAPPGHFVWLVYLSDYSKKLCFTQGGVPLGC